MQLIPNGLAYFLGYIHRQSDAFFVFGHIEKCLIHRDGLNDVGIAVENLMHLRRHLTIAGKMRFHNHQLLAPPLRLRHGLCGMNAEFSRLITRRSHHTAWRIVPHGNRPTFQVGIVELLNRCKKRIHIHVYDFSLCHFSANKFTKKLPQSESDCGNLNGISSGKQIMLPSLPLRGAL